jgi:hypothetical protein
MAAISKQAVVKMVAHGGDMNMECPVHRMQCPDCRGRGKILLLMSHAHCDRCDGTGRVEEVLDPDLPIRSALYLSVRAKFYLHRIGATTLRDVASYSEEELLAVKGLQRENVRVVKGILRKAGLALRRGSSSCEQSCQPHRSQ